MKKRRITIIILSKDYEDFIAELIRKGVHWATPSQVITNRYMEVWIIV